MVRPESYTAANITIIDLSFYPKIPAKILIPFPVIFRRITLNTSTKFQPVNCFSSNLDQWSPSIIRYETSSLIFVNKGIHALIELFQSHFLLFEYFLSERRDDMNRYIS